MESSTSSKVGAAGPERPRFSCLRNRYMACMKRRSRNLPSAQIWKFC